MIVELEYVLGHRAVVPMKKANTTSRKSMTGV
jgi:hypothetical protein